MALWVRFKKFVAHRLDALVSRSEDPAKIIEQLLVELEGQVRQGREQAMAAYADQKRCEKRRADEEDASRRCDEKAAAALKEGDSEGARTAIEQKMLHVHRGERYAAMEGSQGEIAESLKEAIQHINSQMTEARRERDLLLAEKRDAVAREGHERVVEGLRNPEPVETLARMLGRARTALPPHQEDPSASHESNGGRRGESSASSSINPADVDAELSRLKALLDADDGVGVLPPR